MKTLLVFPLLLTSCTVLPDISLVDSKVNESNYMKTPCVIDGQTVKKKPKVINVPSNDTNRAKERKER